MFCKKEVIFSVLEFGKNRLIIYACKGQFQEEKLVHISETLVFDLALKNWRNNQQISTVAVIYMQHFNQSLEKIFLLVNSSFQPFQTLIKSFLFSRFTKSSSQSKWKCRRMGNVGWKWSPINPFVTLTFTEDTTTTLYEAQLDKP